VSTQLFHGSPVTPEELLVLAEFLAPSTHYISDHQLREAATSLAEWTDEQPHVVGQALELAAERHCRRTVLDVLRAAGPPSAAQRTYDLRRRAS
jgi:hypothetical protein